MKKILIAICLLLVACSPINHTRSIPNLYFGTGVNTGTGESLNSAMHKLQLLINEANRLGLTEDQTTAAERNILHNGQGPNTISINNIPTIPTIYSAAGDTSNYPTPGKVGNIYIDTSSSDVYVSVKAIRHNGWKKVN